MDHVLSYEQALTQAMVSLAQDGYLFVGQGVRYNNHKMYSTLAGVPHAQRIEMPVAEDFQMGFSLGLALAGHKVLTLYPRWDFLLLAANQLVNHLGKARYLYKANPQIIIRVATGSTKPLHPGPQHTQDHTEAFERMLDGQVDVLSAHGATQVIDAYEWVLENRGPALIVEYPK